MSIKWIAFMLVLWIVGLVLSGIAEQQSIVGTGQMGQIQTLLSPILAEDRNIITVVFAYLADAGTYIKTLIEIIFLWFPSLWSGSWMWVWMVLCMPISVALVVSIAITMLRGSSSS